MKSNQYSNAAVVDYFQKKYSVVYHKKVSATYTMTSEEIKTFADMTPLLFCVNKDGIDLKKTKEITIYDNYYCYEREKEIREFLFEEYAEEYGWKSPEDIPDNRVWDEIDFQDREAWHDVKDELQTMLSKNVYLLTAIWIISVFTIKTVTFISTAVTMTATTIMNSNGLPAKATSLPIAITSQKIANYIILLWTQTFIPLSPTSQSKFTEEDKQWKKKTIGTV